MQRQSETFQALSSSFQKLLWVMHTKVNRARPRGSRPERASPRFFGPLTACPVVHNNPRSCTLDLLGSTKGTCALFYAMLKPHQQSFHHDHAILEFDSHNSGIPLRGLLIIAWCSLGLSRLSFVEPQPTQRLYATVMPRLLRWFSPPNRLLDHFASVLEHHRPISSSLSVFL